MARMLGRLYGSRCPSCHGLPGPDCADKGRGTRQAKRIEHREAMRVADEQIEHWRGALDELARRGD